jgi:hypothetical protein
MDTTMPDRGLPLSLWGIWWRAILVLRPAFSRLRTFMWFATAVAGLTVRVDVLGVTSIVRALNLRPRLYTKLLDHFHSSGIKLDRLSALWARAVYYAAGKMVSGLLKQGNHLVTRVKSNAVAYAPAPSKRGRRTRGRPRTYGKKIKLKSLLANVKSMQRVASPVYGERNVTLRYRIRDLLWRPARRLVRFVVVVHPTC